MALQYVTSLIDPFDQSQSQPKLLDGSVLRSSGLRFRNTGSIVLPTAGAAYIVLIPGLSKVLYWQTAVGGAFTSTGVFPTHLGTLTDRENIKNIRLVSAGLKLSLLNSSDQNEGYWEAVRITTPIVTTLLTVETPAENEAFIMAAADNYAVDIVTQFALTDMANHATYQTGKLKDINRFMFKVNSVSPQHPWKRVSETPVVSDAIDYSFDTVVIKVTGRLDPASPSTLMYNQIVNQECVYSEGTALARLHTPSMMMKDLDVFLDKTKFLLPSVQIA